MVKPLLMELPPTGIVIKSDQISEATNNSDKGMISYTPWGFSEIYLDIRFPCNILQISFLL